MNTFPGPYLVSLVSNINKLFHTRSVGSVAWRHLDIVLRARFYLSVTLTLITFGGHIRYRHPVWGAAAMKRVHKLFTRKLTVRLHLCSLKCTCLCVLVQSTLYHDQQPMLMSIIRLIPRSSKLSKVFTCFLDFTTLRVKRVFTDICPSIGFCARGSEEEKVGCVLVSKLNYSQS
jgi:hypothetical protein